MANASIKAGLECDVGSALSDNELLADPELVVGLMNGNVP